MTASFTVTVNSTYAYVSRRWRSSPPESARSGAFKIYVDGKFVGNLPALGSFTFSVESGNHTLRVAFKRFSSRELDFVASEFGSASFAATIQNSLGGFFRLLLQPRSSIELDRMN